MQEIQTKAFVNSLPKSGTNLVAKCLDLMGFQQVGGLDSSLVLAPNVLSRLRKYVCRPYLSTGFLVGIDTPVELSRTYVNRVLGKAKSGQFVAGHVGYTDELLSQIKRMGLLPILILRDPRAILNSFVHYVVTSKRHALHALFIAKSPAERYEIALHGLKIEGLTLNPLTRRCDAMNVWLNDSDVHALRFEALIGASGGGSNSRQIEVIESLMAFLGVKDVPVKKIARDLFGPGRSTFRKGSINSWEQEMPRGIQDEAQEVLGDVLNRWGYR